MTIPETWTSPPAPVSAAPLLDGIDPGATPATSAEQLDIVAIKEAFRTVRAIVMDRTRPGRDQDLAITHIEDACMRATRAVVAAPSCPACARRVRSGGTSRAECEHRPSRQPR